MIVDCFTFFAEREALAIRLAELGEIVDYFVLVEATQTFRGTPKSVYYNDLKDDFTRWADKMITYQVDFPNSLQDPWEREAYQRRAIKDALPPLEDEDIVLVSDADEIPRASVVSSINLDKDPVYFDVDQYYWNFNWMVPPHCNRGARPYAVKYKYLSDPHNMRIHEVGERIPNAGWHFSYLGTLEDVKRKIESFSHSEYDLDIYKDLEHMRYCVEYGIDPFDRFPLKWFDVGVSHPKCIRAN